MAVTAPLLPAQSLGGSRQRVDTFFPDPCFKQPRTICGPFHTQGRVNHSHQDSALEELTGERKDTGAYTSSQMGARETEIFSKE